MDLSTADFEIDALENLLAVNRGMQSGDNEFFLRVGGHQFSFSVGFWGNAAQDCTFWWSYTRLPSATGDTT